MSDPETHQWTLGEASVPFSQALIRQRPRSVSLDLRCLSSGGSDHRHAGKRRPNAAGGSILTAEGGDRRHVIPESGSHFGFLDTVSGGGIFSGEEGTAFARGTGDPRRHEAAPWRGPPGVLSGFRTQNTIAAVTRREAPCFLTAVLTAPFPGDRAQNTAGAAGDRSGVASHGRDGVGVGCAGGPRGPRAGRLCSG